MKAKFAVLLVVTVLLAALAGSWIGRLRAEAVFRADAQAAADDRAERQRVIGARLADWVRGSDEVMITDNSPQGVRSVRFRDAAWIDQVAEVLAQAPHEALNSHGLWMTSQSVQFFSGGTPTVGFMWLGRTLRVTGNVSGDMLVVPETIATLQVLADEKMPPLPDTAAPSV